MDGVTAYTGNLLFLHVCGLLLQCKPCTLLIYRHYMCRTDTLLYWRDCFHCYEEKQKTVFHVMDKRTYCLLIKPYNLCSDYYVIDSNYGGGV